MSEDTWIDVGAEADVPPLGSRVVRAPAGDIAVFKAADGTLFALFDRCPHKGGPLSQGIVHGHAVTCPLHNWVIGLADGAAQGADHGCTATVAVKVEAGRVLLAGAALRTGARAA
ncbi:nitrite reductase small subunit NirD [Chelatococcus reniformis]|uniref:Nitrite reductase n=1 Tax=Chelatococcus reniformis TaxID=1494448 RepID=A0A916UXB2_9HYPH|nr:nitrite reductase small subunit NirD [Chelatococcus reniformis]GGC92411.1 nitrite reductase [Chelatococcus reniformis]